MSETEEKTEVKIHFNQHDIYKEEIFTDLKTASIHRFTPVKANGEIDKGRKVLFVASTSIITSEGPVPIQFPLEAKNLQQAIVSLPTALNKALEELKEQLKDARRQEQSRIIVPGSTQRDNIIAPGGGGGERIITLE